MMKLFGHKRDRSAEQWMAEAREHLRTGLICLVKANIAADKAGDEALGTELYDLSHALFNQVMTKLTQTYVRNKS